MATINGTAGNDFLTGTSGNDSFTPGSGTDAIVGGGGTDTVALSGVRANYNIAQTFTRLPGDRHRRWQRDQDGH